LKTGGRTGVYNGIVHRDIKPENILLQQTDHGFIPKLADFGISKSFEAAGLSDMTINGVCGTPAYWPREQITHYRFLHPATDVFSLAAVFYRVLTGVSARPGLDALYEACQKKGKSAPDLADYIRLFADNPVKPIRDVDATIPEPIAVAMDRALRETEVPVDEAEMHTVLADLRYPNAGEFLKAMEAGFEKCGLASST
jgi:serine/threonine protein kinase